MEKLQPVIIHFNFSPKNPYKGETPYYFYNYLAPGKTVPTKKPMEAPRLHVVIAPCIKYKRWIA